MDKSRGSEDRLSMLSAALAFATASAASHWTLSFFDRRSAPRAFIPWGKHSAFPLANCEYLDIACRSSGSATGQVRVTWRMSRLFALVPGTQQKARKAL